MVKEVLHIMNGIKNQNSLSGVVKMELYSLIKISVKKLVKKRNKKYSDIGKKILIED